MKLLTRSTATGILALGLSFGVATSAFAVDDPPPVPTAPSEGLPPSSKGRCVGAINRRIIHLATWTAKINVRNNLTADQKAELVAEMAATSNLLQTVALPAVQNATTRTELRAACRAVLTDYRVYLVVHPRVFITATAWGWLHRIAELQVKVDALVGAGADPTKIAQIQTLLDHATGLAMPIHDALDGITPASYNGNPSATKILFHTAKGDLRTVQQDVKAASKLIKKLLHPPKAKKLKKFK